MHRGVVLAVLALTLVACPMPEVRREREVFGTFSELGTPLLHVVSWTSTDPMSPWFNDATARDWSSTLVATDRSLDDRTEVMQVGEPLAGGGALGLSPLSWHEGSDRAVLLTQGDPLLVATDGAFAGGPRSLLPSVDDRVARFGDAADAATVFDASIAPDGAAAAVLLLLAFEGPNGPFDLRFEVAVFFFDTGDGAALGGSPVLDLDDRVDPALTPPAPLVLRPRMLWGPSGDGVFVLNADEARFVSVQDPAQPMVVTEVPARALATRSLPVDEDGRVLVPPSEDDELVTLGQTSNWVPFSSVPRVALGEVEYAVPLPD